VVGWALRIDPRHVLAPERLVAGGYETAGFMCCGGIWGNDRKTGMSRGLAHLEVEPRENGFVLAKQAREWIEARDKRGERRPLFLWMHVIEPHNWFYGADPRNDDDRRRLYDRTLQQSDQMLAEVLAAFASRPADRAPIVIVTADHGEGLGDHGQPNHSTDLYDSQIRVPLVIAGPGIAPRAIFETVSLTDLTPTLVDLAGFEPPHGRSIDGASFADLATGRRKTDDEGGLAFAAMIKDRSNPGGITAVVKGRWKLVDAGSSIELYDVHTDPGERSNQLVAKPLVVEELKKLMEKYVRAGEESPFE
jgi:arylsulfatase A-like enzyme